MQSIFQSRRALPGSRGARFAAIVRVLVGHPGGYLFLKQVEPKRLVGFIELLRKLQGPAVGASQEILFGIEDL